MGLLAGGLALLSRVGSFLTPTATAGATVAGRGLLATAGRAAIGPFGQSIAGGAIGAGLIGGFGGGGDGAAAGSQLATLVASGAQPVPLASGRFMVTAPNGDMQIFNRSGQAIKPSIIIPAGQRLPGGAIVVSTRNNGSLIGLTIRRRRKRFGAEIRTVKKTVQAAQSLVKLCKPTSRRS